jgi:predicted negative regulator of RcsB-dependent stress response
MSEATQTQTLEETLNKTDLGHLLYEHRKSVFFVILAILLGVLSWVVWKETKVNSAMSVATEVFEFQNKVWGEAKVDKLTPGDLVSAFKKLESNVQASPMMVPVALEMGKFLFDKGSLEEASSILSLMEGKLTHPVSAFFIGTQLAVIYEKQAKFSESAKVLENLLKNKEMMMKSKVALDLGRMYLLQNEKGKAQTQFDYIISNFPNDEYAKLAKLYLSQMSK